MVFDRHRFAAAIKAVQCHSEIYSIAASNSLQQAQKQVQPQFALDQVQLGDEPQRLEWESLGLSLHIFPRLASTNRKMWELLCVGATAGTVVIATQQTAGRGQWGRQWNSPTGGLYLSLALAPNLPAQLAAQLTLCSAWGIAIALRSSDIPVWLKWPNDLVLEGRKLGGILTETRVQQGKIAKAVVGVGINWANPVPETGINLQSFLATNSSDAIAQVGEEGNGEWGMGNGEWGMGNREWGMGNGEWGIGREKVSMPDVPSPMPDARCPMPDARCPMPDARCPMPHSPFPLIYELNSLEMLAAITLMGIVSGYNYWQQQGIDALLPSYENLLTSQGQTVEVDGQAGVVVGVCANGDLKIQIDSKGLSTPGEISVKPGTISLGYELSSEPNAPSTTGN